MENTEKLQNIRTILSFALIPLSGFATDIYVPSLPSMANELHVTHAAVQLSLIFFMVSAGISQLFIGSLLDSYGRYKLGLWALFFFALASFGIAFTHNIHIIYLMRVIQGITVATIVVAKRAYFMDNFSGEKLQKYTSLFSIVWATAPIIAPFLGGYLQEIFGWESNFYFLGFFTLALLILDLIYGKESLVIFQPFRLKPIASIYLSMIKNADFGFGLLIIGLSYSMLIIYGMTSPFIIEHIYHFTPVITGYCALLSGVALMSGGVISRTIIKKPFLKKISVAIGLLFVFSMAMILSAKFFASIYSMIFLVMLLHLIAGFIFNNFFSYCLGLFSKNAGIASGITGGALYIITSFLSTSIVSIISIKDQTMLGLSYLTIAVLLLTIFFLFTQNQNATKKNSFFQEDIEN